MCRAGAGRKAGKARGSDRAGSQDDGVTMLSKFGSSPDADLLGVCVCVCVCVMIMMG